MAKKVVTKVKKQKKKWVALVAPQIMNNMFLGECCVYDTDEVKGRHITLNYMTLTGEARKQHINIGFRVKNISEGKGITEVVRYYIIPSSLRRFVRKGRDKVGDSFIAKTKDEQYIRIKPMLITNAKSNKSVVTNLRTTTKKLMQNLISTYTYDMLVEQVMTYRLQKYLRDCLHKVYPIKICEIRELQLLDKPPKKFDLKIEDISDILFNSRNSRKGKDFSKPEVKEEEDLGTKQQDSIDETDKPEESKNQ